MKSVTELFKLVLGGEVGRLGERVYWGRGRGQGSCKWGAEEPNFLITRCFGSIQSRLAILLGPATQQQAPQAQTQIQDPTLTSLQAMVDCWVHLTDVQPHPFA